MSKVITGLEQMNPGIGDKWGRIGLLCHPASVDQHLLSAPDRFLAARANLAALLGPQHGFLGQTQDNMIEWQTFKDRRTGLPVFSLYGETRKPAPEMMAGIDTLVADLQDVGTRVYTFIYTMALCMEACAEAGKKMVVLDRPNPIGGRRIEGNLTEAGWVSFVGMYPIPMRHGLTAGELALLFNREFGIGCELEIVPMKGWRRGMWFDECELPWVLPSPNMPTLDTAVVYPGTVIFEGINISEGRGTTRPFELIGAPWLDAHALAEALAAEDLPGAVFRPAWFEPTFHKHAGQLCQGVQIHVTDREAFLPFRTGLALLREIRRADPECFGWKQPPYEYELDKLPFDVINGSQKIRQLLERDASLAELEAAWAGDLNAFDKTRRKYFLYED